jgi:plastocyanin
MHSPRTYGLALLACAAVAGCGSSGDKGSSSTPTPDVSKSSGSAAKSAKATIKNFTFAPESVSVSAGGTVSWTNQDSANHNVKFDDSSVKGIDNLREGQSGKVSFDKAGSFSYVCTYHPGMKGTVEVS